MTPDEWLIALPLLCALAYGLSQGYTYRQRIAALWPRLLAAAPRQAPPAPRRRRARLTRRTAADRQREQELIAVALAAGYDLPFLARALRGNPEHNRRRVRKVRARLMQREAVTA